MSRLDRLRAGARALFARAVVLGRAALARYRALSAPRRRLVLGGTLVAALGLVVLWGGGPRRIAYAVQDELGVRLVEGHAEIVRDAAEAAGVDPYLVAAVMFQESRGRVGARSSADALGLMQLKLPAAGDAARRAGLPEPTEEQLLTDAALNVRLGAEHLAWLLDAGRDWNLEQVLVSYHAGRAGLLRRIEEAGSYRAWVRREQRKGARGEAMSASLTYAWRVLDTMEHLRRRGRI